MSRAKLHHLPGYVWHLTHRCHNRDFLLKFNRDRKRWLEWLFYAKKKYRLIILNYAVTSNHIHLLVFNDGRRHVIPRSIMLVASRVALEYNERKKRSGAFWEDHYHATAVGTDSHLHQCLVYVDLNMVRAGVISHPQEWPFCGYHEIMNTRQRYQLIDKPKLLKLLGLNHPEDLKKVYEGWVDGHLSSGRLQRESRWTESIAVGNREFVEQIQARLGTRVKYREIEEGEGGFVLKETPGKYTGSILMAKNVF